MNATDSMLGAVEPAGFDRSDRDPVRPDERSIRAWVRAVVEAHGRLLGEPWDAQADHAEEAVSEVVRCQGPEAGRRWARALEDELTADREEAGPVGPGLVAALHAWSGR